MQPLSAPVIQLTHGPPMPRLGLGTWLMNDAAAEKSVAAAIEAGYRLIDTAELYENERGVGRGIRAAAVDRREVFVVTKFNKQWHGRDLVREACARGLDRLGLDYLDLLLIHWPIPRQDRYLQAWEGMIGLLRDGRVRAIGTSNFKPAHLDRIIASSGVVPDVNQIQLSPAVARTGPRSYHVRRGIATQCWSPLGGRRFDVLAEPVVRNLAAKYGRTPAQIVLRWHVQLGLCPIPKSSTQERMRQNLSVFDFTLEPADEAAVSALDRGESAAADSDDSGN